MPSYLHRNQSKAIGYQSIKTFYLITNKNKMMWHLFLNPNFIKNKNDLITKLDEVKNEKSTFQKSLKGIENNN